MYVYRLLDNCSHIVLDEVHERDVLIDFLMIIIRDILPKRFVLCSVDSCASSSTPFVCRPDLKLIIMSATLHAELLSQYFCEDFCVAVVCMRTCSRMDI